MKKCVTVFIMICFLSVILAGCGDTKTIKGHVYDTYGIFNKDDNRNPAIEYRLIVGNIVWSVILVETIIAPIYFLGFSLYEPVGPANPNRPKGTISQTQPEKKDKSVYKVSEKKDSYVVEKIDDGLL